MKKIAVHLARHRRLLALGGLSLLLHLLALAWIGGRVDLAVRQAQGVAIALRLERASAAPVQAAAEEAATAAAPVQAPPSPAREPVEKAAAPAMLPPLQALLPAAADADQSPQTDALPAPAPATPAPPASGNPRGAAVQTMPGRYQVRMPPSARLRYALSRSAPGRPPTPAGDAQLVWEAGAGRYQLRLDGVLGLLESEGGGDDAGIAPEQASEHADGGGGRITRFDRTHGRIASDSGKDEALYLGSQDRASVLLQLAGMGIAAPEQMQGTIEVMVIGPDGARIVRYAVLGRETLSTGAGELATVRLAEQSAPGTRRVEFWLAPERNWMPVQLRVTEPDGSIANQVVTSIDTAPAVL